MVSAHTFIYTLCGPFALALSLHSQDKNTSDAPAPETHNSDGSKATITQAPVPQRGLTNMVSATTSVSASAAAAASSAVMTSTWNPPFDLVTPLDKTWERGISAYSDSLTYMNYGFDQVIAGKGKINHCVRWESNNTVDAAARTKVESAIRQSFNQWIIKLAGFDGFPYNTVDVNVVGWAVTEKNLLLGDVSDIQVYTTVDEDGIPQCDPLCGRIFHLDGDYSGCPAGVDRYYGIIHRGGDCRGHLLTSRQIKAHGSRRECWVEKVATGVNVWALNTL